MSKQCFICNRNLGMMTAKAVTADREYLCSDDVNKLFGKKMGSDISISLKAGDWIRKHKSSEIAAMIEEGQTVAPSEPTGKQDTHKKRRYCVNCGMELGFLTPSSPLKDHKYLCESCTDKLFSKAESSKLGLFQYKTDWLLKATDVQACHYLKEGKQLIMDSNGNITNAELFCPHCGSINVQPLGQHRKGFSVGKAVGGAVLTGGVGALAGFAGKKTKQTDFVCMDCGQQFQQ